MANPRPESLIIPSGVFDEINRQSKRNSVTIYGHSSSSSIDSSSSKQLKLDERNSSPQTLHTTTTTSSTTTDSDFESDQDDSLQSQDQLKNDPNYSNHIKRRIKRFNKLFKSEIPDAMPTLIDSYVCAYQGDILLQGKMYITDRYLCFHSRIINYVTKHVYRWEQINNVTKERVAFIFPTAIGIQLKPSGKKIIYASFIQRDQAFDKINLIWTRSFNGYYVENDDDDDGMGQGGTLKATNVNERTNYPNSYDFNNQTEQDVLKMCWKSSQKRPTSLQRKSSDEKQSSKKSDKRSSSKLREQNRKETNDKNNNSQTTRNSRYTKNDLKTVDKTTRNHSRTNQRSQSRHRTSSRIDDNSPSITASPPIISPSVSTHTNSSNILNQIFSILNQIYQSLSLYVPSHPIKSALIILLILTLLFLHSFYLIKLAFRIENRLQSLHHIWPSSSSPVVNSNQL